MAKIEYIKSQARASELDEGDFISIGGQKFQVAKTIMNDYGNVVVYFSPMDDSISSSMLIVPEHFLFTIHNQIPKK